MASTNGTTLGAIRKRRHQIQAQISQLQTLLTSLDNVIDDFETDPQQIKMVDLVEEVKKPESGLGLTGFMRQLFKSRPEKKWAHASIKAEVEHGIDAGTIKTSLNNMDALIYSTLRRLIAKGEIDAGGKKRKRWYRKKTTLSMALT